MKNSFAVSEVCSQIGKASSRIGTMAVSLETFENTNQNELYDDYVELIFDELEQLQRLTLALTKLVTANASEAPEQTVGVTASDEAGGSAFSEGELTSNLGDKTDEQTGCNTE